jgi:hypothetical protein
MSDNGHCLTCDQITDYGFGIISESPGEITRFYLDHFPLTKSQVLLLLSWLRDQPERKRQIAQRLCKSCADERGLDVGYLPITPEDRTNEITLPVYSLG